ncbi:hypothetical protein ACHQM5_001630 [Ranunculus cassubicifolius]
MAAADAFVKSVEDGLKLAKRVYFGKDRASPPKQISMADQSSSSSHHIPSAPMVYAVISDPSIVDNPDVPSYQPHVHGRCDPPALIPLQMNTISLQVEVYFDTAFVTVIGSWRLHCVMASKRCNCKVAIPMGQQGSILGVDFDLARKSYSTQLIDVNGQIDTEKSLKEEDGGFLKPHIFTMTLPQVDGGSNFSIKMRWSQKLSYDAGQFTLSIPFDFPEYVSPTGKKTAKREKIQLNVNSGTAAEVICKGTSHSLKEIRRQVGKLGFIYEADVLTWSNINFSVSYIVSSANIFGGLLLQTPSLHDSDQRDIFCLYLSPGNSNNTKVFRKQVVFLVDTSESMKGTPLENVKNALHVALSNLSLEDSFNIIAFNGETYLFSSSLEPATKETVEKAIQWININFIAEGGTNILLPLNQAMEMLSSTGDSIPLIFLITDGSVEDERHICDVMRTRLADRGSMCPRVSTFGIGKFCNHYFLQTLALIGRGYYGAALEIDAIGDQLERLLTTSSNIYLSSITIDGLDHLNDFEAHPFPIPDITSKGPVIVSGRYDGKFPKMLKARGFGPDMSKVTLDLKVDQAKDIPLDKVFLKKQIDLLTSQAWHSQSKQLEEKVAKMSIQFGFLSEYTRMVLFEMEGGRTLQSVDIQEIPIFEAEKLRDGNVTFIKGMGLGFGNLEATKEGFRPGFGDVELAEVAGEVFVKAASNCCSRIGNCCCCYCCVSCCDKMNNQCGILLTQVCTGLAFLGCFSCCSLCCGD